MILIAWQRNTSTDIHVCFFNDSSILCPLEHADLLLDLRQRQCYQTCLFNLWYAMQVFGCLDTWMHIHLIGMTFQATSKPPWYNLMIYIVSLYWYTLVACHIPHTLHYRPMIDQHQLISHASSSYAVSLPFHIFLIYFSIYLIHLRYCKLQMWLKVWFFVPPHNLTAWAPPWCRSERDDSNLV